MSLGLLGRDGEPLTFRDPESGELVEETLVVLDGPSLRLRLKGVASDPVLSVLRGFSAPVRLSTDAPPKDAYLRLAGDPDLFNRWEAGQDLARALMLSRAAGAPDEVAEERFAEAMGRSLSDQRAEPAFQALLLALPGEADIALAQSEQGGLADPAAVHEAREALRTRIAVHLAEPLRRLHGALQDVEDFSPGAAQAGKRALRNAALDLLAADPGAETVARARGHFDAAANMTDAMGGLSALMLMSGALDGKEAFDQALARFYERWQGEPLVVDKWFALQARSPAPDALARVIGLTAHPAFEARNPNRLRALVQSFASGNAVRFHDPSGAGYRFLADQILATDAFNPSVAARMLEPLGGWRRYRLDLAGLMRGELSRIAAAPGLSNNVLELAQKAVAEA